MSDGEIVSVVFTDLVGSTSLADRLGDAGAEDVRQVHFALLRGSFLPHRGKEVKNLGDGLMVVFSSVLDAVDAAIAMQRAVARHNAKRDATPIHVRIGVHVGEPIRAENDYFGTTVNTAARLCGAAEADQILVSRVVGDLVESRGTFEFRPVGPLTLKGLSRPVQAAEIAWTPALAGAAGPAPDYRVLGPVEVSAADGSPVSLAEARHRVLLACLLAHPGEVVSEQDLVEALWGERTPPDPRDALQALVSGLRRQLGPSAPLEATAAGYRFTAPERLDSTRFERLTAEARRLAGDPHAEVVAWDAALAVWRGEAFADVTTVRAIEACAARLAALRDEAVRARDGALRRIEGPVEVAAGAEVRADDVSPARTPQAPAAGPDAERDAGLDRPRPTRLPMPSTSFVGREVVLESVLAALEGSRLVTLTGPGGMGKTRMSLEVAHRLAAGVALAELTDGPVVCELGLVPDDDGVVFALAAALGVRQTEGISLEDAVIEALSGRRALAVIDNCEHVLDGIVPLLERVLGACPGVRVLASSRERLAADGETVIEIPPLEVPDVGVDPAHAWDAPSAALALLRDRVSAIRSDFRPDARSSAALMEVARQLDGLPLALELAAARIASLGAVEVAARLDQRFALLTGGRRGAPARHRTLRATVEWSYDLLAEAERRTFERASVFVGGFTLQAAEAVCPVGGESVAALVAALVDKSILIVDDHGPTVRYRMLELLREFGLEQLAATGELAPVSEAHARHYVGFAWRAEPELRGPDEADWVGRVSAETGNLRAAHTWALSTGHRSLATELSSALSLFSYERMRADLISWADELADDDLASAGPDQPRVLFAAGMGAWIRGEPARAAALADRSIHAAAEESDRRWGYFVHGAVAITSGRLPEACEAMGRSAALARDVRDSYTANAAFGSLAIAQGYSGDLESALKSTAEARLAADACAAPSAHAWAEYALGEVLNVAGDPEGALEHLDRAVSLADSVRAHFTHGVALVSATSLRVAHSEVPAAAVALVDVIDEWRRFGNWRQQWVTLRHATVLLARAGDDRGVGVLLGAIAAHDGGVYGADAERLNAVRTDLLKRKGPLAEAQLAEGGALTPAEVVAFTTEQLGRLAAADVGAATGVSLVADA